MRSLLHQLHEYAGATFRESGDWLIPDSYGDWTQEYAAGRERVAIMDASHWGKVSMTGKDAQDLLNRLSTNALMEAPPGTAIPTVLTSEKGRILDHILAYVHDATLTLLVSPGNTEAVVRWLDKYIILEDVKLADITSTLAVFSLIGPKARALVYKALGLTLDASHKGKVQTCAFQGHEVWVSDTSLVHLSAVDVIVPAQAAHPLWQHLLQEGRELGAAPLGDRAYQPLRIEAGTSLLGHDMGLDFNPLEAGLWDSVSFTKGCYIGQEVVARLNTYQKVKRHLRTLHLSGDTPVPSGTRLISNGEEAGLVTSWAYSPGEQNGVAIGYVNRKIEESNAPLKVPLKERELDARIMNPTLVASK